MIKFAQFSACGKYRYALTRIWDGEKKIAMCIGLNPSTAGYENNDPTIESLIRLLKFNGYGGFHMTNLFGIISPDPNILLTCENAIGENDEWLLATRCNCQEVIFCWGNFKQASERAKLVIADTMISDGALCFGKNKNG